MGNRTETTNGQQQVAETPSQDIQEWARAETLRRIQVEDQPPTGHKLQPPENFSNEYAPEPPEGASRHGPESRTIAGLLAGSCSGWAAPPTAEEFYDAMRAKEPTSRQQAVIGVLLSEATELEMFLAHREGAFTWRQLARAAARRGCTQQERIRWINFHANKADGGQSPRQ